MGLARCGEITVLEFMSRVYRVGDLALQDRRREVCRLARTARSGQE